MTDQRDGTAPVPVEIRYRRDSRVLELGYADGRLERLSAEFLRVHSPSAEVRGHGPGQEVLPWGKAEVGIVAIEPVGRYAIQIRFDDGHDSGIYSFEELDRLARERESLWAAYLARLEAEGRTRAPGRSGGRG